jgi:hypothetical protein
MKEIEIPFYPAHKGSKPVNLGEALRDQNFCVSLLGILLLRSGEKFFSFSQSDFDSITGISVLEGQDMQTGEFLIGLAYPAEKNG